VTSSSGSSGFSVPRHTSARETEEPRYPRNCYGSAASVAAAIREDAAAEAERIDQSAATEIAALKTEAATADVSIADRERQIAAARREADERVAQQEWQGRRAFIEAREAWIAEIIAAAQQRWSSGSREERIARLTALATEALERVAGDDCVLTIGLADADIGGDAWAAALASACGKRRVRIATGAIAAGCIASAGNLAFDNSVESRARRLEPEWRNALAAMFSLGAPASRRPDREDAAEPAAADGGAPKEIAS